MIKVISDEERRKVAQKLREVETLEWDGSVWCDEWNVLNALGLYNNDDPNSCNPDKVAYLAYLIDRPTCFDAESKDRKLFTCSVCGFSDSKVIIDPFTLSVSWVKPNYHYCPKCGSEVVEW